MVVGLTPEQEEMMRRLWRLRPDDKIAVRGSPSQGYNFRSHKTGTELGFIERGHLFYSNPYYEIGRVLCTGITVDERCNDVRGEELCLCLDDLVKLGDAIEKVLETGPGAVPPEAKETIGALKRKCPMEMRSVGGQLEERDEFKVFILNGPKVPRDVVELYELRKKRFGETKTLQEFIKDWYPEVDVGKW